MLHYPLRWVEHVSWFYCCYLLQVLQRFSPQERKQFGVRSVMNPGEQSPNHTLALWCHRFLLGADPLCTKGAQTCRAAATEVAGGWELFCKQMQTVEVLPCTGIWWYLQLFAQNDRFHSSPWQSQNMFWDFLIFGVEFIRYLELQDLEQVLVLNTMNIHEHGCGMLFMIRILCCCTPCMPWVIKSHPMRLLFYSLWHCTLRSNGGNLVPAMTGRGVDQVFAGGGDGPTPSCSRDDPRRPPMSLGLQSSKE